MQYLIDYLGDIFHSFTPIRLEIITGGGVAVLGTIIGHFIGGWSNLIEALIVLMIIDYVTGLSAAWINPNAKLDSRKGTIGIVKKIVLLGLVALAHQLDVITGQDVLIRDVVLLFFIGNEGLSILENASNCGLPIPTKLKDGLAQFTQEKRHKGE